MALVLILMLLIPFIPEKAQAASTNWSVTNLTVPARGSLYYYPAVYALSYSVTVHSGGGNSNEILFFNSSNSVIKFSYLPGNISGSLGGAYVPKIQLLNSNADPMKVSVYMYTMDSPVFAASKTTPTNGSVTVSISYPSEATTRQYQINGGSWATYSSPIVMDVNGTVTAKATSSSGITSTNYYSVTNIDKTPPIPATFTLKATTPPTMSIAYPADAAVKEYKLNDGNWTTYTQPFFVALNDTIFTRSTDAAGNVSTESSLSIEYIDTTPPSSPGISLIGDTLTLIPGSDTDSGVKETVVKVGFGGWTVYSNPITLADGSYSIQAKTIDKAGNESVITTQTIMVTAQAEASARTAVLAAEKAGNQAAVNEASALIAALPNGDIKNELLNRVSIVQDRINAELELQAQISAATASLIHAQGVLSGDAIQEARSLVEALPEGEAKSSLFARLTVVNMSFLALSASGSLSESEELPSAAELQAAEDAILVLPDSPDKTEAMHQFMLVKQKVIATSSVMYAEQSNVQADVDEAQNNIDLLPAGEVKTNLQQRLDVVQEAINLFLVQLAAATEAVEKAESTHQQTDVDAALAKVTELSEMAVPDLYARLDALQAVIDLNTAILLVNEAKSAPTPNAVALAQQAIDKLPGTSQQADLQVKLESLKHSAEYLVPLVADKQVRSTLSAQLEAVQKAERYETKTYIVSALDKLNALSSAIKTSPLYSDIVTDLQTRADKCKENYNAMVAEMNFATNLAKAQSAISYYERYRTATYQTKAQEAINLLPDNKPEKTQLQAQLDALVSDFAYQELLTKAETAVTNYEKYRTAVYKTKAADTLLLLPTDNADQIAKKDALQARFDAVIPK